MLPFSNTSVYITYSCIPPSSELPEYFSHFSAKKGPHRDQLVVLGDFNVPGTLWSKEDISNIHIHIAQYDFINDLLDISMSQVKH